MLDKIDRKLLSFAQQTDCTLFTQALADAVNLTTTLTLEGLKRLETKVFFARARRAAGCRKRSGSG